MDMKALEGIGLSNMEAKIFVALLELGESKAGDLIKKSNIQSSSVYNAVNSLINKGLISYVKKSNVRYYQSVSPETVINYIESKKQEYFKLLPELKLRENKKEMDGVEFFKSYKGIKTLMFELIKDSKPNDIYRSFSVEDPTTYKEAKDKVFSITKQYFKKNKIKMRGIFHEKNRYKLDKESIMERKYLSIPLPPNTMILNNKTAIVLWDNEPSGILIKSKSMAESYSKFFDAIWKLAKK